MNAEFSDELISAYLDNEVTPAERELVERVLAENAEYRQMLDELRALRVRIQELPKIAPRRDVMGSVQRRAERAALLGDAVGHASSNGAAKGPGAGPATTVAAVDRRRVWTMVGTVAASAAALLVMIQMSGLFQPPVPIAQGGRDESSNAPVAPPAATMAGVAGDVTADPETAGNGAVDAIRARRVEPMDRESENEIAKSVAQPEDRDDEHFADSSLAEPTISLDGALAGAEAEHVFYVDVSPKASGSLAALFDRHHVDIVSRIQPGGRIEELLAFRQPEPGSPRDGDAHLAAVFADSRPTQNAAMEKAKSDTAVAKPVESLDHAALAVGEHKLVVQASPQQIDAVMAALQKQVQSIAALDVERKRADGVARKEQQAASTPAPAAKPLAAKANDETRRASDAISPNPAAGAAPPAAPAPQLSAEDKSAQLRKKQPERADLPGVAGGLQPAARGGPTIASSRTLPRPEPLAEQDAKLADEPAPSKVQAVFIFRVKPE